MLLVVLRNVNSPRRCCDGVPIILFASLRVSAVIMCPVILKLIINIPTLYGSSPIYVVPSTQLQSSVNASRAICIV
jgi:hypothetical protein